MCIHCTNKYNNRYNSIGEICNFDNIYLTISFVSFDFSFIYFFIYYFIPFLYATADSLNYIRIFRYIIIFSPFITLFIIQIILFLGTILTCYTLYQKKETTNPKNNFSVQSNR
jgi:hypothetical protein